MAGSLQDWSPPQSKPAATAVWFTDEVTECQRGDAICPSLLASELGLQFRHPEFSLHYTIYSLDGRERLVLKVCASLSAFISISDNC